MESSRVPSSCAFCVAVRYWFGQTRQSIHSSAVPSASRRQCRLAGKLKFFIERMLSRVKYIEDRHAHDWSEGMSWIDEVRRLISLVVFICDKSMSDGFIWSGALSNLSVTLSKRLGSRRDVCSRVPLIGSLVDWSLLLSFRFLGLPMTFCIEYTQVILSSIQREHTGRSPGHLSLRDPGELVLRSCQVMYQIILHSSQATLLRSMSLILDVHRVESRQNSRGGERRDQGS